jgi:cytochrome b involved in lipid metabolism
MPKIIIGIVIILILGFGGSQIYTTIQKNKIAPVQESTKNTEQGSTDSSNQIPATSTDSEGNTISNTPDPRFGGDGQEDPVTGPAIFTMADMASHNNEKSCYTTIRGNVYDLTSFINKHPGGSANILKICGKDGTSAFENKHGGRPKPEQELAGLQIGVLK